MSSIPTLVAARRDDLVVQELPDEVLVYDLKTHQAHCLNLTAAFVWNHCDGKTPPLEIAARMAKQWRKPVGEAAVWIALKQLSQANLLQQPVTAPTGVTRRSAMRRIGLAAAVALPLVTTVLAPTAVMAQTIPIPPACATCVNKQNGAGACPNVCAPTVLGSCYDNAGCGGGQRLIANVTCTACFAGTYSPPPGPSGLTVSWRAPN